MTTTAMTKELLNQEPDEDKSLVATQWQLMWWKFRRHKLAVASGIVIMLFYLMAIFCEFLAPYDPTQYFVQYKDAPPSKIRIRDAEGRWRRPFIYRAVQTKDPETMRRNYHDDTETLYPIHFFVRGGEVKMWGLFTIDRHLFGLDVPHEEQGVFLMGADVYGRDLFSRVAYGARLSLSIGIVGVVLSLALGIILGGLSGYYGGLIDSLVQRSIEFIRTLPTLPLWMALSAALPSDLPILQRYFGITIVLSLISWTGMARVVRGRFLALREEDFVMAARMSGANEWRVILIHMVPSFLSHIIASLTLRIPQMILGETSLSFLGLGLLPPAVSWGVLLRSAQNLNAIALQPWKLIPAGFIVITVLCFNFLGDGLRDAADPYAR
jgi:peptide/nickel transport system permease protein